ncbi:MAG: hypothetical protein V2I47_12940 [Bacteroidales bacterium]|jgi:hypothetical protein|nr:hypothetical protein [Bacteroidales bacterium]
MNEFLKRVLMGNGDKPSEICLRSFNHYFEDAINVEWFRKEDHFEVLFYKDNLEHIAIFSQVGVLIEYRHSLPPSYLPDPVSKSAGSKGEIMNVVLKNMGNIIEYEIIIRSSALARYLINVTELGKITEEKKL